MSGRSLQDELHRLLELFEENPQGRLFAPLADCYRKLGRLEEAARLCVDGLARHPRYSTGFVILGKIYLDRGDEDEARTAFETVLSMDPENLVALDALAELSERRGEEKKARDYAAQLRQLDPSRGDAATAREAHGDGSQAVDESEEAEVLVAHEEEPPSRETKVLTALSRDDSLQNTPDDFDPEGIFEGQTIVTVTLADVYYEQGFKTKALEMYQRVLQRHPTVPGVVAKVEAIERELAELAGRFTRGQGQAVEEKLENLESTSDGSPLSTEEKGAEEHGPVSADDEEPSAGRRESDPDAGHFRSWIEKRRRD